jgi:hypothetical protein
VNYVSADTGKYVSVHTRGDVERTQLGRAGSLDRQRRDGHPMTGRPIGFDVPPLISSAVDGAMITRETRLPDVAVRPLPNSTAANAAKNA